MEAGPFPSAQIRPKYNAPVLASETSGIVHLSLDAGNSSLVAFLIHCSSYQISNGQMLIVS
jgi:hypothetical protein